MGQATTAQPGARAGADIGEMDESLPLYNLEDDMVKLVAYTIVSIKRDAERVMPEGEGTTIVTDRMSGYTFTSWIIARYVQKRWATVEKEKDAERRKQLKEELEKELRTDRKYLRVYYVVSHRWPREPLKFEERQIDVLEQIRDVIDG